MFWQIPVRYYLKSKLVLKQIIEPNTKIKKRIIFWVILPVAG